MASFESLQGQKVAKAEELLKLASQLHIAEFAENHLFVSRIIEGLPSHLKVLLPVIREQESLCAKDDQRLALLHEEYEAVKRAFEHAESVRLKRAFGVVPVVGALNIIRARTDTYSRL